MSFKKVPSHIKKNINRLYICPKCNEIMDEDDKLTNSYSIVNQLFIKCF